MGALNPICTGLKEAFWTLEREHKSIRLCIKRTRACQGTENTQGRASQRYSSIDPELHIPRTIHILHLCGINYESWEIKPEKYTKDHIIKDPFCAEEPDFIPPHLKSYHIPSTWHVVSCNFLTNSPAPCPPSPSP